jgi:uncharacterized protein (TIGR03067 family)
MNCANGFCWGTSRRRWVALALASVSILWGWTIAVAAQGVGGAAPAASYTATVTVAGEAAEAPAGELTPKLVGPWQVESLVIRGSNGESLEFPRPLERMWGGSQYSVVFTDKALTLRKGSEAMAEMSYVLDPKQQPCAIDAKSPEGAMLGICRLQGGLLSICFDDQAKGRPRAFDKQHGMMLSLRPFVGFPLFVVNADGSGLHQILAMPEFTCAGSPDWSHDGRRIALDASRTLFGEDWTCSRVFVVNADGTGLKDMGPGGMPSWSPDDKQLTYSQYGQFGGEGGAWIMNADGSGRRQLEANGWGSQWCPTRNEVAYLTRDNRSNLCVHNVANDQRRMLLDENHYTQVYEGFTWSPDGKWICFKGHLPQGGCEIAAVSVEGEKKGFKVLLPSSARPESDTVSKTMAWGGTGSQILVTMQTKTDRRLQMYVLDFAGGQPRLFPGCPASWISDDMAWSPDGKKVVFTASPLAGRQVSVAAPAPTEKAPLIALYSPVTTTQTKKPYLLAIASSPPPGNVAQNGADLLMLIDAGAVTKDGQLDPSNSAWRAVHNELRQIARRLYGKQKLHVRFFFARGMDVEHLAPGLERHVKVLLADLGLFVVCVDTHVRNDGVTWPEYCQPQK